MFDGIKRTGRRMPKTPGSTRLLVCSTGTPETLVHKVAWRTVLRRVTQERVHEIRTAQAPKAHSAKQISVRRDAVDLGCTVLACVERTAV
jgi:hypothetical protein